LHPGSIKVKAGPKGRSPLRLELARLPKAGRARVAASIEGFIATPTGTGPETAEAAAVATRDHQYFDAPRIA
jgi:hypothetical protein